RLSREFGRAGDPRPLREGIGCARAVKRAQSSGKQLISKRITRVKRLTFAREASLAVRSAKHETVSSNPAVVLRMARLGFAERLWRNEPRRSGCRDRSCGEQRR